MSDDLISRKALMEEIDSLTISITGLRAGKGVLVKFMEEYKKSVLKCIDEAPTAYDVDAVCEELEKFTKGECTLHECGIRSERCSACMAGKAIDIVRNGGKKE